MFNLFLDKGQPKLGALNNPLAETIRRQFDYTEKVLTEYYSISSFRLPNQHLLVQVLRAMSFALDTPFEDIWGSVYARVPYVAKHYGFTSTISFGRPHSNMFYGGDKFSDYVFETRLKDVEPFGDKKEWRDISPIKVVYHPVIDFHFLLPSGYRQPYTNDFSVTMLDLGLLVFQYHQFKIEQYALYGSDAVVNPSAFLVREVLPKMYKDHLNLVIINNIFRSGGFAELEEVDGIPWPPVSFPDMSIRVKPMATVIHRSMRKKGHDYARVLESIPLPRGKNALRYLILPRIPKTKQGYWLYWLARFRYMFELIRLGGDRGIKNNRKYITSLKTELGYFMGEKGYLSFQNKELEDEFIYFANYVKNI